MHVTFLAQDHDRYIYLIPVLPSPFLKDWWKGQQVHGLPCPVPILSSSSASGLTTSVAATVSGDCSVGCHRSRLSAREGVEVDQSRLVGKALNWEEAISKAFWKDSGPRNGCDLPEDPGGMTCSFRHAWFALDSRKSMKSK
jgi:hypothetical protein